MHDPGYSGTTTAEWSAPRESDFGTDDPGGDRRHARALGLGLFLNDFLDLQPRTVDPERDLDEGTNEGLKDRLEDPASEEFGHDLGV